VTPKGASAPLPALDRCASCGQPSDAPARCPHCGASLLVDVVLDPAPTEPRLLFGAARAAAEAGVVPGLDFARARASLKRPGAVVAEALPRDRARALISYLAIEGFGAAARASAGPPRAAGGRFRARLAAAVGAVAVLAGAGAALLALRGRAPAPAPREVAAAPEPAATPGPPAERREEAAPEKAAPALSTAELARLARPALAVLTCRGKLGSGFFVGRDRVLTNAHVTCGAGSTLDVKLGGGRQLIGRVRAIDPWLDFAVVEVPGAEAAAPLALGDSTSLAAGDPVVLVGSPLGLEATVHDGKVSFVARNLEGVAHVQLNADVNPGNSGGPLLDGRGRVVGIVTLKAQDASGVGFALPVEYAREALEAPPLDPAARERWDATRVRVRQEDDAEAARLVARLERPLPLSAAAAGDRLALVVMQRFPRGSTPVAIVAEVRDGEKLLCESRGEIAEWDPIERRFQEAAEHDRAGRKVRWMVRRGISTDAYAGAAQLDVSSCPASLPDSATITIRGAGDEVVAFPVRALEAGRRTAEALGARAARVEADDAARSEAAWRQAFREARERVAGLETRRRALLGRDPRRELPAVEADLAAAREALDELERRASFQAVPREWRR
jgi:serine protease Do